MPSASGGRAALMTMAVSSYRYQSQRTDEPLRTRLVELAREKPRFGYRRLHVLLRRCGEHSEPQAGASGVSGGRADDSAEEAETLRARGTSRCWRGRRRTRSGRWILCTMRWSADGRSGC